MTWAEVELRKLAAHIGTAQIAASVLPLSGAAEPVKLGERSFYEVLAGCEFVLEIREPQSGHAMQLLLCVKRRIIVRVSGGPPPASVPGLAVLSAYARLPSKERPGAPPRRAGFLNRRQSVGQVVRHVDMRRGHAPATRSVSLERVTSTFRPEHSLHTPFKAEEWNLALEKVHTQLEESIGIFREALSIGRQQSHEG